MESFYCDVLSLHPQPLPLESFTSYISRLSEANGLKSVEEIARLLFLGTNVSSNHVKHLTDFPLTSFGILPTVSVCPESRLLETTFFHLARKFGRHTQNLPLGGFFKNTIAPDLRYCPQCLVAQTTPYYSLLWRFVHLATCPHHGCPLLDHCIHCGNKIPLFSVPPKIPFCVSCKKDLRQHHFPGLQKLSGQALLISGEELEMLLLPHTCELEENIPLLLSDRLMYKARIKSMKIIPIELVHPPRRIEVSDEEKEEIRKRIRVAYKIKYRNAIFINYLNYIRFLGIKFDDLFNREFFTTMPSDEDECAKQLYVMSEKKWNL